MYTEDLVYRYLLSNSFGQWNGALKAHCHIELCRFYVAAYTGVRPDEVYFSSIAYKAVHELTQKLTDHLDETIGFPTEEIPDFDKYGLLFFEKFHALALEALLKVANESN